jgi:hypothetical protein
MLGWVDNVSAAGALFLLGGLGIVNFVKGDPNNIGDLIPVDLVSDFILIAACYSALSPPGTQLIFHCCSSELNPVSWGLCSSVVQKYWKRNPA